MGFEKDIKRQIHVNYKHEGYATISSWKSNKIVLMTLNVWLSYFADVVCGRGVSTAAIWVRQDLLGAD